MLHAATVDKLQQKIWGDSLRTLGHGQHLVARVASRTLRDVLVYCGCRSGGGVASNDSERHDRHNISYSPQIKCLCTLPPNKYAMQVTYYVWR